MNYKITTMIGEEELEKRITEIADQINSDYEGEPVHLICILKGGVYFLTELSKYIKSPVTVDFMMASSYGSGTVTSGAIKIKKDLDDDIEGKNVIVVEDIIDTGLTLDLLLRLLKERNPKSLKLCALLNKPERRVKEVQIDYCGFDIPDKFVVGYGLDVNQRYRNLSYIGYVEEVGED